MPAKIYVFVLLSLSAFSAYGDAIYKWIDENGKVQYGNTVPDKLKDKATKVDANRIQLIDAQHSEPNRQDVRKQEASSQNNVTQPASSPANVQPVIVPESTVANDPASKKKQCEEAWARYQESRECFAPYVTVNGAVKAEGFEHCTVVKQPQEMCD